MDSPTGLKILEDVSEEVAAPIYGIRSQICVSFWILWKMQILKANLLKRL
jgi:hypothetical protein